MTERRHDVPRRPADELEPVILRMREAGHFSPELLHRIEGLSSRDEVLPAKSTLQVIDEPVRRPRYLLSGWACRFQHLSDGRRQIYGLVLPGEGVGVCLRQTPLANTTTMTLTPVRLVDAGALIRAEALDACIELRPALQAQADADERRAMNQILRLGRLDALERLAHLFLELHERLEVIGHTQGDRFPLPLTQETLADMTGLSVVHVNRTLQELRRENLARVERGWVHLPDRRALAQAAEFQMKEAALR